MPLKYWLLGVVCAWLAGLAAVLFVDMGYFWAAVVDGLMLFAIIVGVLLNEARFKGET